MHKTEEEHCPVYAVGGSGVCCCCCVPCGPRDVNWAVLIPLVCRLSQGLSMKVSCALHGLQWMWNAPGFGGNSSNTTPVQLPKAYSDPTLPPSVPGLWPVNNQAKHEAKLTSQIDLLFKCRNSPWMGFSQTWHTWGHTSSLILSFFLVFFCRTWVHVL